MDAGRQVADREILDVLDRVDAQTVEIEALEPPHRVGDHLLAGLAVLPVDVGHVRVERAVEAVLGPVTAGRAALATGAEPVGMRGVVLVLLVDVIDHEVHQHANAALVSGGDERVEVGLAAEPRIDRARLDRPVAVERGDAVTVLVLDARRVLDERRQPQCAHAERVERAVLDRRGDAAQIAALEFGAGVGAGRRSRVVRRITVAEAIGHHHVDQRVAPIERVGLDPERHEDRLGLRTSGVGGGDVQRVLAGREAGRRDRQLAAVTCDLDRRALQRRGDLGDRRASLAARQLQAGRVRVVRGDLEQRDRAVGDACGRVLDAAVVGAIRVARVEQPFGRAGIAGDDQLVRPDAGSQLDLAGEHAVVIGVGERRARAPIPGARDRDRAHADVTAERERGRTGADRGGVIAARRIRTRPVIVAVATVHVRRFAGDKAEPQHREQTQNPHARARSKAKTTLTRWKIVARR